jgi:hypothetical protein
MKNNYNYYNNYNITLNHNIVPIITYINANISKDKIYRENKGKSDIYRWNNYK